MNTYILLRTMKRFAVFLFLAGPSCSSGAQQELPQSSARAVSSGKLRHTGDRTASRWATYSIERIGGPTQLYVAHTTDPKPVVILIHGSGCGPVMTVGADGTYRDTTLFQDVIAARLDRLHFAIVEKRGVEPLRFSPEMTLPQKQAAFRDRERRCSPDYLQSVTKQNRVDDVGAAVVALGQEPWAREILLLGHSEGTHVATGVLRAAKYPVTAAGLFASAGPTPFFGGYMAHGLSDRERFAATFEQIRWLQRSDDNAIHQGLPVRRFRTFWLESTSIEDVRDSIVPLFIAQGTKDGSTVPADLFTLEAIRQQPNRPIRYVVVENAGHAFDIPDGGSRVTELFDRFVQWATDPQRQTGLDVIQ
jgi:pimeloyl-ACP methyl ester carboxylesterase